MKVLERERKRVVESWVFSGRNVMLRCWALMSFGIKFGNPLESTGLNVTSFSVFHSEATVIIDSCDICGLERMHFPLVDICVN